jgi:ribonucleoside-diphosphate reductase subunit M2
MIEITPDINNLDNNTNIINISSIAYNSMPTTILDNYDPVQEKILDNDEELLDTLNYRLSIKPIQPKFEVLWFLYKKQVAAFWTPEEIDFTNDIFDFKELDINKQHFIKQILAFFAGADAIVVNNIKENFSKITVKEAECAYGYQQMMENIHGEVYANMLINIIQDTKERDDLINAFKTVESIKRMIGWANKWITSDRRIGFSIMAFTIFEGLMFSGAFASIYWLKKILGGDKMKGLIQSNNLIARDEGLHTNFGCLIYDYVIHRLSPEEAQTMMTEAVDIAKTFTQDSIRVDMIGMNERLMGQYLEYIADRLMIYLGYDKIYNTRNPEAFSFMETIGFLNKDNFFERRPTEYQKAFNSNNTAEWRFNRVSEY